MNAAERWTGHIVAGISQTKTYFGLRQNGQVEIAHAARGREFVGRFQNRNRWAGSWRIQRIGQQVEIKEVVITPEAGLKVVPLVLINSGPQDVLRLTTPSEAADK